MNCKHGVSMTEVGTFTLTADGVTVITCACCGSALRLSGPTATKPPAEYCNLCKEAEALNVSVVDDAEMGERL